GAPLFALQLLHDPLQFLGAAFQRQLPVLHPAIQHVRSNRAVQRRHEVVPVDGLLDEVAGPAAESANHQLVLAMPGDYEGGRVRPARPDLGQQRQTVHPRHLDVGDDRVVVLDGDPLERRRRGVGRLDGHPTHPQPQGLGQRLQQGRVVVDDEDAQRPRHWEVSFVSAGARGRWMRNVAPAPGWLTTEIVPPCSLMIPYVIERPRPVPLPTSLVVKNGSKIRRSSPGGIPCPLSANETSTAPESVEPKMRMALRGASATASRALVNKLMKTCSSCIAFPRTTGSSGRRSTVTSLS